MTTNLRVNPPVQTLGSLEVEGKQFCDMHFASDGQLYGVYTNIRARPNLNPIQPIVYDLVLSVYRMDGLAAGRVSPTALVPAAEGVIEARGLSTPLTGDTTPVPRSVVLGEMNGQLRATLGVSWPTGVQILGIADLIEQTDLRFAAIDRLSTYRTFRVTWPTRVAGEASVAEAGSQVRYPFTAYGNSIGWRSVSESAEGRSAWLRLEALFSRLGGVLSPGLRQAVRDWVNTNPQMRYTIGGRTVNPPFQTAQRGSSGPVVTRDAAGNVGEWTGGVNVPVPGGPVP